MSRDIINRQQNVDPDHLHTKVHEVQQGVNTSDNKGLSRELSFKAAQHSVDERIRLGQRDPKEVHAWLVEQLNNGMSLTDLRMMNNQRILEANQKLQEGQGELPRYDRGLPEYHKEMQEYHKEMINPQIPLADLKQEQNMNYQEIPPLKSKL